MRLNRLRDQACVDITFDDMVCTPTGDIDYHPDLTTAISGSQWCNLYDAMAFALRQGIVMNVHVTIVWGRLGVFDVKETSQSLKNFCAAFRKHARKRARPCAYAYAYENTRDEGLHTHLLASWDFGECEKFEEWVEDYARLCLAKGLLFDPAAVVVRHKRDGDVDRHWMWFGYITKGTDPKYYFSDRKAPYKWRKIGDLMLRRYMDGGTVRCRKRVGVSRNIDFQAQKRAGFSSALEHGARTKETLYTGTELRMHEDEKRSAELRRAIGSLSLANG